MVEPDVVLLGRAAVPWPEAGCCCRTCLEAAEPARQSALGIGKLAISGSEVAVGEARELAGVRIVGLPGPGGAPALVLASRTVGTVLWAPASGDWPEPTLAALAGADLDVAALGVGDDGTPLAHSLARLRGAGALADGCDVVAVGLDHTTARAGLAARLRIWGARLAAEGAPLGRAHAAAPPAPPRRTLVLGPAASGKSALAETLLAAEPEVDYLPTGPAPGPDDADWAARVAGHRGRRPAWWHTLEGADPVAALPSGGAPLLLDSVGTWVSGALEACGAWDDAAGWQQAFDAEVDAVVRAWRRAGRRVVAVGEETGWGVVPATPAGRRFRDCLGTVNRRLAAESEQVLLVVGGRVTELPEGVGDV